jgi:hypothetical protein
VDALALGLVIVAAAAHAAWNLMAKQAGGGVGFVWMYTVAALVLWAPVAALFWDDVSWAGVGFMAGSGVLHALYFTSLQRAYAIGDLSVVYPLARGTGRCCRSRPRCSCWASGRARWRWPAGC